MEFKGLNIDIKNKPVFEPDFIPVYRYVTAYVKGANQPYAFALERNNGNISKFSTMVYGTKEQHELDIFYLKLLIRASLNFWGGWKLYLCGNEELSAALKDYYLSGETKLDSINFAEKAFSREFTIEILPFESCPSVKEQPRSLGFHLDGCRIGFDAGASDRKVAAVVDGETIYAEEVLWYAKFRSDIDYHYNEIVTAFKTAASKMPRVDAIGVSTASLVVDNRLKFTSFFKMIPPEIAETEGADIYLRAAKEIGDDIPITILTDGAVSALAGAMVLNKKSLLGIAVGTSIGMGYIDSDGKVSDRSVGLASNKVSLNEDAPIDEWGNEVGVGDSYFSQNQVIRLAEKIGIEMPEDLYPAEKLLIVQEQMENDHPEVRKIYEHIGCCLAHTLPLCGLFFDLENVYLCGRVFSNKGGELILSECQRILAEEYPEFNKQITVWLPDEKARRVSQSVAAASLPEITK